MRYRAGGEPTIRPGPQQIELSPRDLLRLVRSTHQWDEYVDTMSTAAAGDIPRAIRRDVLLRLAAVFEQDLGDLERAEKVLVAVLSLDERDPAALESLDRIYLAQGTYENLAEILKRRIALADSSTELVALHLRLGRIDAEALDDLDGAIASYLAVLEHEPSSLEALEALERLYFRSERWSDLLEIYEKLVALAKDPNEVAGCHSRMARLAPPRGALDITSRAGQGTVLRVRLPRPIEQHEAAHV